MPVQGHQSRAYTQVATGFGARLVDPFLQTPAVAPVDVPVLTCRATYAEKLRAALTRREPTTRDFYDIDHAVRSGRLKTRLIELVRGKLAVPGNDSIDVSARKYETLTRQILAQLRPVLRESDFTVFDLERAFGVVAQVAVALQ